MTPLEVADRLLEVMVAAFADAGRPHPRHYVSDGGVLWDWTPLLAVEWEGTEPHFSGQGGEGTLAGSPATMSGGFVIVRTLYSIHVTRDSPWPDEVGTPPQPAKIRASAEVVFADALLVLETLVHGFGNSSLLGVCGHGDLLRQTPVGPDGGVVGSVTSIAIY